MQKKRAAHPIHHSFLWTVLMVLAAIGVFLALSALSSSPPVQAQTTDSQSTWTDGGIGEVAGEGQRFSGDLADPNADFDDDGIKNSEEGDAYIPGYGSNASSNPGLCTLMTKGGVVTMKIDKGRFRYVEAIPDDPNKPEKKIDDPEFPYGFIKFWVEGLDQGSVGEEVQLKILFPNKVDAHAKLCSYNYHLETWQAQISYDIGGGNVWKYDFDSYQMRSIKFTLKDNDPLYDAYTYTNADGMIKGIWGLGVPKSSSKGRCFIQTLPCSPLVKGERAKAPVR